MIFFRTRLALWVLFLGMGIPIGAQYSINAQKTIVVVSSENPKISGQLFHPKICPNLPNYMAFVRQFRDNRQLWVFNAKNKELNQIGLSKGIHQLDDSEEEEQGFFQGYEDELAWCPTLHNGKQYFAFVSAAEVNNHDVYVSCIGCATSTRLTWNPEVDGAPHWAPNGKGLVFVSARTGNGDLYFIPDATIFFDKKLKSEPEVFQRLTKSQGEEFLPAFAPDGRFLAFTMQLSGGVNRGRFTIALMDFHDKDRKISIFNNRIANNKSHPSWSSDGHFIAYQISNDLNDRVVDLGVMQLKIDLQDHLVEVAALYGLSSKIAENVYPNAYGGAAWLPGSRALVYAKREATMFNPLEVVNLEKWLYDPSYKRTTITTFSKIHRDVDCLPNDPIVVFAGESGADYQIFASLLLGPDLRLGARKVSSEDYDLFKGAVDDASR